MREILGIGDNISIVFFSLGIILHISFYLSKIKKNSFEELLSLVYS